MAPFWVSLDLQAGIGGVFWMAVLFWPFCRVYGSGSLATTGI